MPVPRGTEAVEVGPEVLADAGRAGARVIMVDG
jgi:hypothetical protein